MSEIALIGKKIGMTREFYKTGQSIPVTVVKMEKGRIIDLIQETDKKYKNIIEKYKMGNQIIIKIRNKSLNEI